MRLKTFVLVALMIGAVGCGSSPRVDRAAEVTALRAAALAYYDAAGAKDREAVLSFYDSDAILVPPGSEYVEGPEAVQAYRFGFIETPGISLEFTLLRVEVSGSGDMGWTLADGDISIDRGPDEPAGRDMVRDFHTWHKQVDGSWKVAVDFWNSGPVDEL